MNMGFQPMGPGAMGVGAAAAAGAGVPPGMPQNQGQPQPFHMPAGLPPMGGVYPGQMGMPVPPVNFDVPSPDAATGTLGKTCWNIGRTDAEGIRMELDRVTQDAANHANFDRVEYLSRVCGSTTPQVFLAITAGNKVVPVYGLGRYHPVGGDATSMLDGKYFVFLGNGDTAVDAALHVLPTATIDAFGAFSAGYAAEMATLDAIYAGNQNPTTLLPPADANTAGASLAGFWKVMPVPHGLVHLFAEGCHPYEALLKLRYVKGTLPTQLQKDSLKMLEMWLRRACHSTGAGGQSCMALSWDPTGLYGAAAGNSGVTRWAQARFKMFLPREQTAEAQCANSTEQALTAQEVKDMMKEEMKASRQEPTTKGCRKLRPHEYKLFLAVAGLPADTKKEQLVDLGFTFVRDWEDTPCKETSMRTMMAGRVEDSATALNLPYAVRYLRTAFVNSVKDLTFSKGLGLSWYRSQLGLCITAVGGMIGSAEQAAADESLDQYMNAATHTTAADEEARLGKPSVGPRGLAMFIKHVNAYLITFHSVYKLNGAHAKYVKLIRAELLRLENDGATITQEQIDDMYWSIFLDGRFTLHSPDQACRSKLGELLKQLENGFVNKRFDTPSELSPNSGKRSADDADTSGYEESYSPSPFKRAKTRPGGDILNYHKTIKDKWQQLCAKWGTVPSVKEVAGLTMNPATNKSMTFLEFSEQVVGGTLCAIGQVTGTCQFYGCTYNHNDTLSNDRAKKVCKILDNAMKAKQGLVKKEKAPG